MSATIIKFEAALVRRCGPMMTKVGMDGTTQDGTNADLADPIVAGLMAAGYEPADPFEAQDSDLINLDTADVARAMDGAELRTLSTCWARWTEVDMQQGDDAQKLAQLADRLLERIQDLEAKARIPYGPAIGAPAIRQMEPHRGRNDQARYNRRGWPER